MFMKLDNLYMYVLFCVEDVTSISRIYLYIRAFYRLLEVRCYMNHPPEFDGSGEPPEAKRWIKHMEKIFLMANCTAEEKVVYATNQFRGAAQNGDKWNSSELGEL
jgi:hypothetical protein